MSKFVANLFPCRFLKIQMTNHSHAFFVSTFRREYSAIESIFLFLIFHLGIGYTGYRVMRIEMDLCFTHISVRSTLHLFLHEKR